MKAYPVDLVGSLEAGPGKAGVGRKQVGLRF